MGLSCWITPLIVGEAVELFVTISVSAPDFDREDRCDSPVCLGLHAPRKEPADGEK